MSPSVDTPVSIKREPTQSPPTPTRGRPSKLDRSRSGANTSSGTSPTTTASANADVLRRAAFRHHTSIEQLLAKRTDLRLVDVHQQPASMGGADVLGPDEEIWMVQCARNVPVQQLVGLKLNLGGARKTARLSDDLAIEYQSDAAVGRTHSMVCRSHGARRHELVSFQPVGTVRVHKEIQETLVVDIAHVKQAQVPYPTGLKVRHPLHGSDYEKLTNLSADIKSKLRSAVRASGQAQSEQQPETAPTLPIKQERTATTKRVKSERGVAADVEAPAAKTVAGKKRKAKAQVESGIDGEVTADVSAPKKAKRVKEHVKLETVDDADEEPGANLDWLSAI